MTVRSAMKLADERAQREGRTQFVYKLDWFGWRAIVTRDAHEYVPGKLVGIVWPKDTRRDLTARPV